MLIGLESNKAELNSKRGSVMVFNGETRYLEQYYRTGEQYKECIQKPHISWLRSVAEYMKFDVYMVVKEDGLS